MSKKIHSSGSPFLILSMLLASFLFVSCSGINGPNDDEDDDEPDYYPEYITEVFECVYAPGQHARNIKPEDGKKFIGKPEFDVYLGGFGGYIIAGFDHNVMNVEGKADFEVFSSGVSPEPAVVYVMCDENGDGKPNETWYELKGSEFENKETIRNYSLTYYKAADEKSNIRWKDNQQQSGELISGYNGVTSSPWWWGAAESDSITFTGTRLPQAYIDNGTGDTQNWIVPEGIFTWGYAENNYGNDYSKESKSNKFDLANAVDADGNPVKLPHIRFIKVQTGVLQQAGWLNEISSEVQGARDLNNTPNP